MLTDPNQAAILELAPGIATLNLRNFGTEETPGYVGIGHLELKDQKSAAQAFKKYTGVDIRKLKNNGTRKMCHCRIPYRTTCFNFRDSSKLDKYVYDFCAKCDGQLYDLGRLGQIV